MDRKFEANASPPSTSPIDPVNVTASCACAVSAAGVALGCFAPALQMTSNLLDVNQILGSIDSMPNVSSILFDSAPVTPLRQHSVERHVSADPSASGRLSGRDISAVALLQKEIRSPFDPTDFPYARNADRRSAAPSASAVHDGDLPVATPPSRRVPTTSPSVVGGRMKTSARASSLPNRSRRSAPRSVPRFSQQRRTVSREVLSVGGNAQVVSRQSAERSLSRFSPVRPSQQRRHSAAAGSRSAPQGAHLLPAESRGGDRYMRLDRPTRANDAAVEGSFPHFQTIRRASVGGQSFLDVGGIHPWGMPRHFLTDETAREYVEVGREAMDAWLKQRGYAGVARPVINANGLLTLGFPN